MAFTMPHQQPLPTLKLTNGNKNANGSTGEIVLVAKFDYKSNDSSELDLIKNERLILIDNSKNWWLVKKYDSDLVG
jgi:hypothetical protein